MFSLGWLAFLLVFVGAAAAAVYLIRQEVNSSREKDILFKEAAAGETDVSPPLKAIEEYEQKRQELFQELLQQELVKETDEDLGEGESPERSWQRVSLSPENRKILKVLLLRRALGNARRWIFLSGEGNAKFRLYRHGLLTETAWAQFQETQEELNRELQYIKLEAECIEPEWGERVLRDAIMLHRLQEAQRDRARQQETEQRRKERDRERQIKEQERQREEEQQREIQRERKAEKLRDQLVKEAEQQQQQSAASTLINRKPSK